MFMASLRDCRASGGRHFIDALGIRGAAQLHLQSTLAFSDGRLRLRRALHAPSRPRHSAKYYRLQAATTEMAQQELPLRPEKDYFRVLGEI